jgi:hypothetical protein
MVSMNKLILGIIILALVVGVLAFRNNDSAKTPAGNEASGGAMLTLKDNPLTKTTLLNAVDGSDSSGTAYILRQDGRLMHRVEALMPDPAPGSSYEGWLVEHPSSPIKFFSTGVMTKEADGTWVLHFEANEEYSTYNRVVITEETVIDATPETHIVQGDF